MYFLTLAKVNFDSTNCTKFEGIAEFCEVWVEFGPVIDDLDQLESILFIYICWGKQAFWLFQIIISLHYP